MNLIPRAFLSLVSCSLGFIEWDGYGWLAVGGVALSTASFMVPFDGLSADTRIHYWARDIKNKNLKYLFPNIDTSAWVFIVSSWTILFYGTGALTKNNKILEYISLTLEAIFLTQFYHNTFKLLMGREGPPQGDGRGIIYGPKRSIEFWPYGTPSGHIGTLFAMTTVAAEYFDNWALRIISYFLGAYYAANLIYNESHFASDLIWGAAIGYFTARWVVKHRSSRYTYTKKKKADGTTSKTGTSNLSPGDISVSPFFDMGSKSLYFTVNYHY